ncbi:cytochrome c [Puniceicoccaceae bacterium K14]|nr:cytochrome c [Puniceicoccaceae bacterium K14]
MNDDNQQNENLPGLDQGKANDESLVKTHARIRREYVEGSPVAFFTAIALILVLTFSFFYIRRYMAGFDDQMYLTDREHIAQFKAYDTGEVVVAGPDGAKLYQQQCVACHQATGLGLAGAFPPLAGSDWVTGGDGNVPIRVLLAGLTGPVSVNGESYNGAMPAFGPVWDDEHIAAVVSYIRQEWDNGASEVTPEQVSEIRSEIGSRGNWTEDEIRAFF